MGVNLWFCGWGYTDQGKERVGWEIIDKDEKVQVFTHRVIYEPFDNTGYIYEHYYS